MAAHHAPDRIVRTPRERIDPELAAGLDAFITATGPRGLAGIVDPVERRAVFGELMAAAAEQPDPGVATIDRLVPGPPGAPEVGVRVYRPVNAPSPLPALYYIHGGGMVIGDIETEDAITRTLCATVGCAAVSVDYRLAPEHPHPAPVEDCYAGLVWMAAHAEEIGIDPARIAVYGGSAGGALAAATALLARDRGGPRLAYQMLLYPMLDDRSDTRSCAEIDDLGVWDGWANAEGWQALLGGRCGTDSVDSYAAPARAKDLAGLPPAWIDVGELDALRDENVQYALRLMQAGVATDLHVHPGAFHAWEVFVPDAAISRRAVEARRAALRRALA
jgi:acetyl esterase/lipase